MGAIQQEIAGLEPGTHACLPYVSAHEHRSIVAIFLREGLRRGERCVYVSEAPAREAVSAQLAELGTPVARARAQGALVMLDVDDIYPREVDFDPDRQIQLLGSLIDAARAEGFNGFRGVGEAPREGFPNLSHGSMLRYEAAASDLLRAKRALGLCVYDRRSTDADTMVSILRCHPQAILAGRVCGNPFCDPPAYLLGRVGEDRKLDWMINQILGGEQSRQFDQAVNDALLREATSLAAQSHRLRDRLEDVHRAVDARDLLCGMLARRLRAGVTRVASWLESLQGDRRIDAARGELEAGREDVEALLSLASQIESVAAFNEMHGELAPEPVDLAAAVQAAVAIFTAQADRAPVEVTLQCTDAVWGRWDRRRVSEVVSGLLAVACEHGWSSALEARVEELGDNARLSVRFHAVDFDPKAGAPGLAGGRAPSSAYDHLGIELWTTRELVRVMGGTFGVSSYADGRVTFTVDLPRGGTGPGHDGVLDALGVPGNTVNRR
jgi:signal transduction histidine kinase